MEKKLKSAGLNSEAPKDLLENYSMSLKALNRSAKTVAWYLEILRRYFDFLESASLLKPVNELGSQELKSYILHLKQSKRWPKNEHIKDKGKLSPYSIQGHVRAIKAFWSWLLDEGYLEHNPLAHFPLPKVPRTLVNVLTIEHLKRLLGQVDRSTASGERLYCLLLLLTDTGMRISEAVGIKLDNIDFTKRIVTIVGKGQKYRVVPFSKELRKELSKYMAHCRDQLCEVESAYLFPSRDGDHVTVNSVEQALTRLGRKAGLQGVKCHPHIFRHTFATSFIAKGGEALVLKAILGHESLQPTLQYVHLQPEDLQKQHAQYSLLSDLFGH